MLKASSVYREPVLASTQLVTEYRPEEESSTELVNTNKTYPISWKKRVSEIWARTPKMKELHQKEENYLGKVKRTATKVKRSATKVKMTV